MVGIRTEWGLLLGREGRKVYVVGEGTKNCLLETVQSACVLGGIMWGWGPWEVTQVSYCGGGRGCGP